MSQESRKAAASAAEARRQQEHRDRRVKRCPDCRLRIRGPNHNDGRHHNGQGGKQ